MAKFIVGVYIENPEIFSSLVKILKRKKVAFTLNFDMEKPGTDLVITDSPWKIKGNTKILVISKPSEAEYVVERAILASKGAYMFNSLLIGVDPGENIGFAVIGDGEFIKGKVFRNIKDLISEVKSVIDNLLFIKCRIRIGFRNQYFKKILAEILKIKKPNVIVELVDEKTVSRTIPKLVLKTTKVPRDVVSAVNIAFVKGVEVSGNAAEDHYLKEKHSA